VPGDGEQRGAEVLELLHDGPRLSFSQVGAHLEVGAGESHPGRTAPLGPANPVRARGGEDQHQHWDRQKDSPAHTLFERPRSRVATSVKLLKLGLPRVNAAEHGAGVLRTARAGQSGTLQRAVHDELGVTRV